MLEMGTRLPDAKAQKEQRKRRKKGNPFSSVSLAIARQLAAMDVSGISLGNRSAAFWIRDP